MTNANREVTEQELQSAAKAPRVTQAQIDALKARISYQTVVPEGTTTTLVLALLDGKFRLAIGEAACVDPKNFNAEIGERLARGHAEKDAEKKLWELEGYRLYGELNPTQAA